MKTMLLAAAAVLCLAASVQAQSGFISGYGPQGYYYGNVSTYGGYTNGFVYGPNGDQRRFSYHTTVPRPVYYHEAYRPRSFYSYPPGSPYYGLTISF